MGHIYFYMWDALNHFVISTSGIELVEDGVQNALRHEMQEIRRIREEMEKLENQVDLQLSKNDELKKKLKQNIAEKKSALDIDRDCSSLGPISSKIHNNSGCQVVSNQHNFIFMINMEFQDMKTRSSILSWEQQTDLQLNSSTEARAKSLELGNMVKELINSSCNEAMSAWNQTNKYKNQQHYSR